jgi:hypothetical protein
MITSAKFSELGYDGDDLATVDLTLRPFYCLMLF